MKRIRAGRLFRGPPGLDFHGKESDFLPLPLKLEDHADDGGGQDKTDGVELLQG